MQDSLNIVDSFNESTINTIITVVGGFIGAVLIFYLGRWYERKDSKREDISNACKEFISIFDYAVYKLTATGDFADIVLFKEMPKHKIACDKFRTILTKTRKIKTVNRFDEIWNEYYCSNPPEKYDTSSMGKDVPRELVLKRINAIIDFVNNL